MVWRLGGVPGWGKYKVASTTPRGSATKTKGVPEELLDHIERENSDFQDGLLESLPKGGVTGLGVAAVKRQGWEPSDKQQQTKGGTAIN